MAVISKGIKLSYGDGENFTELTNLQEIAELGNSVRNREKIDITTLADDEKIETEGLKEARADEELPFKFLYEKEQFMVLNAIDGSKTWKVELPDGTSCTFGGTCNVKLAGVGVSNALTYTLNIKPNTEMSWA